MLSSLFIRCVYFHGPCQLALSNSGLAPSCADANILQCFCLVPPYLAVLSYDTAPESIRIFLNVGAD